MENTVKVVVENMFAAFSSGEVEKNHPFRTPAIYCRRQYGGYFGRGAPTGKKSGKELKQKWVQVYTVENGLITRMEEFATSEVVG